MTNYKIQTTTYTYDDNTVFATECIPERIAEEPEVCVFNRFSCCGLGELNGIYNSSPEQILSGMWRLCVSKGCVVFTQVKGQHSGPARLFEFIVDNKLGVVTKLPECKNPNTGNIIIPYAWNVDFMPLKKWVDGHKKQPKTIQIKTSD